MVDSSDQAQLRQTRVLIFLFFSFTSVVMIDATSARALKFYTKQVSGNKISGLSLQFAHAPCSQ